MHKATLLRKRAAMRAELTIVIPTFNERANVRPLVDLLTASLGDVAWEAVFVDDDSPDGTYDEVVVYSVPGQARDMADMIKQLFQLNPEAGTMKTTLFTPLDFLTKANMKPGSCWSLPGQ